MVIVPGCQPLTISFVCTAIQEGNAIEVTLNEPSLHQKGAYVALKLHYMYKPDLGFGALHEVLDGRNEAINNFYSHVRTGIGCMEWVASCQNVRKVFWHQAISNSYFLNPISCGLARCCRPSPTARMLPVWSARTPSGERRLRPSAARPTTTARYCIAKELVGEFSSVVDSCADNRLVGW